MKYTISDLIEWFPLKQQVERFYPFTLKELKELEGVLDFSNISFNRIISWDRKLLQEFSHKFDWSQLSWNPSVMWNDDLVKKFENYIDWTSATANLNFPWTRVRFFKVKDLIDWGSMDDLPVRQTIDDITFLNKQQKGFLGRYQNVEWSAYLIERFKDDLNWGLIGGNSSIPFSEYFFRTYIDRLYFIHVLTNSWLLRDENLSLLNKIAYVDFNHLSEWKEDWTAEFITRNQEHLNWDLLSANQNLPWNTDLLLKYEGKWNWYAMSGNRNVPWTWDLIEKFEDLWKWTDASDPYLSLYRSMSTNPSLPWSQEFVERFGHHMEFGGVKQLGEEEFTFLFGISSNTKIDWDIDFLLKYKDQWDFEGLAANEAVYKAIEKVAGDGEIIKLLKAIL